MMGLIAKQSQDSVNYEPMPSGNFHAICFGVVDLGTHETEWMGKTKYQHKVAILWEIPEVRMDVMDENGNLVENLPRFIRKEYTLSLDEKSNLYADLVSWRGCAFTTQELAGFDLKTIIGANCLLNIVHRVSKSSGNTYAMAASVSPIVKGMEKKASEREMVYYSWVDHARDIPENVFDFMKDQIRESKEYKSVDESGIPTVNGTVVDDDIPF